MKKREIFIVIIVITFGILYNLYESGEVEFFFFDECSINPRRLLDKNHSIPFALEECHYSGINYIEIENPAGEIFVRKAEDNTNTIKPVIRVYHKDKDKARRISREIKVLIREENGKIAASIKPSKKFPYKRVRVCFELSVAENVELKLYNAYGNIEILGAGKNITLNDRHGDILVKNVDTNLKVHSRHGEVSLANISESIEIYSQHGKIKIKDVSSFKLNCSYSRVFVNGVENETAIDYAAYCNIEVENSGKLHIEGRQTRIRLKNIRNGVNIVNSHNSINMNEIKGDIKIMARNCRIRLDHILSDNLIVKNSYGNVDINNVSGKDLDITVVSGDLDIKFIQVEGRINIKNRNSDILVDYPGSVKPSLNIDSKYGKIINRTSIEYNIMKDEYKLFVSRLEGKPEIIINNTYGDIILRNFTLKEIDTKAEPEEFVKPVEKTDKENN